MDVLQCERGSFTAHISGSAHLGRFPVQGHRFQSPAAAPRAFQTNVLSSLPSHAFGFFNAFESRLRTKLIHWSIAIGAIVALEVP